MTDPTESKKTECQNLEECFELWLKWSNRGCRAWSFVYHLCFGLAAVFGVIVATISNQHQLQVFGIPHDVIISALSVTAALSTTIGAFGAFEQKWRTNRKTRAALRVLEVDNTDPKFSREQFRARMRQIIDAHEAGILSAEAPGVKA